jgi:hypothetical protein
MTFDGNQLIRQCRVQLIRKANVKIVQGPAAGKQNKGDRAKPAG